MVGSVLRSRMTEAGDWQGLSPVFFSTSSPGGPPPEAPGAAQAPPPLADAFDPQALAACDVLVTCQGSEWTKRMHPQLRENGWQGIFIDAASALRMAPEACIVLDPLNRDRIDAALERGMRDFIGGNCTVSLMLMGLGGLLQAGKVEWMTTMTYQAASGGGARKMTELVRQMSDLGRAGEALGPAAAALDIERAVRDQLHSPTHPTRSIGHPLAASLLPWIDAAMPSGQSREEWKAQVEAARILGLEPDVPIDGVCVRVGSLRCHAQAVTMCMKPGVELAEIEALIKDTSPWTILVPNTPEATLAQLTPAATTGLLTVPVGRLRQMTTSPRHFCAFTVGDQLLWGAAEPLKRMLSIVREHQS